MKFDFNLQRFAEGGEATPSTTTGAPAGTPASGTPSNEPAASPKQTSTPVSEEKPAQQVKLYIDRSGHRRIITSAAEPTHSTDDAAQEEQSAAKPAEVTGEGDKETSSIEEETATETQKESNEATVADKPDDTSEEKPSDTKDTEVKSTNTEPLINTQPYTLEQLNMAIQMGNVNEGRIPPQYLYQYNQYKSQQTQQQQMMQTQQAQLKQQQQKQAVEQQKQLYAKIDTMAKDAALKQLGLTAKDLEIAEYSDDANEKEKISQYQTALEWNRQQLINGVQMQQYQKQQAQQSQKSVYNDIATFVTDAMSKEKNFAAINQFMSTYYKAMPYQDAHIIADAVNAMNAGTINPQQCKVLQKYYEDSRVAWYAKKNDLSTTPKKTPVPKVEKPGTGTTSTPKAFDFNKLRTVGIRDRRAMLHKFWSKERK
ncbi:hypothetical protein NXG27_00920 [Megasphaera paucivorans]|uniref:Uncharacterized protein n=1 Tax=Megasphaera paucivorans TaxID=349095 RepID=A0A1G9QC64_9FIRM|nr:hypothetical protein [Megasphaera paucivorans]SDM08618.1 hypothetical protein SAMN05660299_00186 [Megasphaera paucivorans]